MGNEYKEKTLRATDPTWSLNQSRAYMSLPRNMHKNKTHNYNNSVSAPQYNSYCTLSKKSLSKVFILCEGNTARLCLPENSENNLTTRNGQSRHFATWNGQSLNKDEAEDLKAYIVGKGITTFTITLLRQIDDKNGLIPLFTNVISQSPKIDKLCINIQSQLDYKYLKKLFSCAIESLKKSEGLFSKNIHIGSGSNNNETCNNILEAINEMPQSLFESKTHDIKIFACLGTKGQKLYNKQKQKYPEMQCETRCVNSDSSDANAIPPGTIEISRAKNPSKISTFTKFVNKIISKMTSSKSAYDAENTDEGISTNDNQDSLEDNVVLGDPQSTADYMYL